MLRSVRGFATPLVVLHVLHKGLRAEDANRITLIHHSHVISSTLAMKPRDPCSVEFLAAFVRSANPDFGNPWIICSILQARPYRPFKSHSSVVTRMFTMAIPSQLFPAAKDGRMRATISNGCSVGMKNLPDVPRSGYTLVFYRLSVAAAFPKPFSAVLMRLQDILV